MSLMNRVYHVNLRGTPVIDIFYYAVYSMGAGRDCDHVIKDPLLLFLL